MKTKLVKKPIDDTRVHGFEYFYTDNAGNRINTLSVKVIAAYRECNQWLVFSYDNGLLKQRKELQENPEGYLTFKQATIQAKSYLLALGATIPA